MPPNKKKSKRPAVNPARGFATTSIASKSKVNDEAIGSTSPQTNVSNTAVSVETKTCIVKNSNQTGDGQSDLSNLRPEELEARLEREDLQIFVEKHAAKANKEASKNVSKLVTERRLARANAEPLNLKHWLESTQWQRIVASVRAEDTTNSASLGIHSSLTDEQLTEKLWTLKHALKGLGFSAESSDAALVHLAQDSTLTERATSEEARDGLWGLSVSLDWLGISYGEADLPGYNFRSGLQKKPQPVPAQGRSSGKLASVLNVTFSISSNLSTYWLHRHTSLIAVRVRGSDSRFCVV